MKEKLLYEIGSMTYYEKIHELPKAIEWRQKTKELLNGCSIRIFDPTNGYKQNKEYNPKGVVYQNLYYLQNADILLMNAEYLEHSPGSLFEVFIGFYLHKPIICFGYSRLLEQPHIKEAVTIHFNNLPDSIEYIKSMYLQ